MVFVTLPTVGMFVVADVFAGCLLPDAEVGIRDVDLGPLIGSLAEFWCHRVSSPTLNRITGASAAATLQKSLAHQPLPPPPRPPYAWSGGEMVRA